jgi:lipopolysaccharide export system ATP-binding protein
MKIAVATATMPDEPVKRVLLDAERIEVKRKGRNILRGITVRVASGEVVGLLGPNGAGKTTLLRAIGGWSKTDGGKVLIEGQDVTMLNAKGRAGRGLVVCPAPKPFWTQRRSTIEQFASAIGRDARVICLDEPFNGIAPMALAHAAIAAMIESLKNEGCGILIADHNVRETLRVVDRAYLIYDGSILRKGTSEFLTNGAANNGADSIR